MCKTEEQGHGCLPWRYLSGHLWFFLRFDGHGPSWDAISIRKQAIRLHPFPTHALVNGGPTVASGGLTATVSLPQQQGPTLCSPSSLSPPTRWGSPPAQDCMKNRSPSVTCVGLRVSRAAGLICALGPWRVKHLMGL